MGVVKLEAAQEVFSIEPLDANFQFKLSIPAPFCLFRSFQTQILQETLLTIRTKIVGVEGEHTDHLTTTTALA